MGLLDVGEKGCVVTKFHVVTEETRLFSDLRIPSPPSSRRAEKGGKKRTTLQRRRRRKTGKRKWRKKKVLLGKVSAGKRERKKDASPSQPNLLLTFLDLFQRSQDCS